jgi:hypothetical protein
MCPAFDKVDAALNNYNAISSLYGSLGAPMFKADTPTSPVLEMTKSILDADPAGGPRYILFVTDGEPDFCDDGDEVCPTDSVVRHLQQIYAAGITTFVFGIQSPLATLPVPALQAFANAGAGQPVQPLSTSPLDTYYRCMGSVPWWAEHTAAGLGMQPLGVYAATGGDARVYRPDPSDPQALTNLLASTISGVKSCVFDLVQGLRVDLGQLDRASVVIGTTTIPRDAANGWSMASETRLVLSGSACAQWRTPEVRSIDFRFPCGVVGP